MAKQRPDKKQTSSEKMLALKPPIHRIAANSIMKNAPVKKDLFKITVPVAAARMQPKHIGGFRKYAKDDVWNGRKINCILGNGDSKLVVLDPQVDPESDSSASFLTVDKTTLSESARSYIEENGISIQPHSLDLDYDFWTVDEILSATLPTEIDEIPSGFSTVGHIAHMNLRNAVLPYKYHIGAVVLSKTRNQGITTVVNKLDSIDSTYRNFKMEVIAGQDNFIVTQNHLDCEFTFDFSKVYWNTRLNTEHGRLVDMFHPGEGVCDVFAGVGPFAVPAGKKKVFVLSNDLNPASYESMEGNITSNKVERFVRAFNEDGRDFIRASTKRMKEWHDSQKEVVLSSKRSSGAKKRKTLPSTEVIPVPQMVSHFVMNLPATAIEFLDAFRGVYQGHKELFEPHTTTPLPMIHVYCFQNPMVASESILQEVRQALGYDIDEQELIIHNVRNVSPNKDMFCCTFRLPAKVAFNP